MGLLKTKATPVVPSTKIESEPFTMAARGNEAKKNGRNPLTSGLMKRNRIYCENFRNATNGKIPTTNHEPTYLETDQYYPCAVHSTFCNWGCDNHKYQYSIDFLHEMREKMYENSCRSCHCYTGPSCWKNCSFHPEAMPPKDPIFIQQPRSYNILRRLLYGQRVPKYAADRNQGQRLSPEFGHSNPQCSDELFSKKQYGSETPDQRSERLVSPRAPPSFETSFHRNSSPTSTECCDKLSLSIWQKFDEVKQTEETFLKKMNLWRNLYKSIQEIPRVPKFELFLLGSTISGFGMEGSDIDMCIVAKDGAMYCDQRTEALDNLLHVKHFLEKKPSYVNLLSLICANVPILRLDEKLDGTVVEISFNNYVGIRNTQLLHCYAQLDWRVRPLVMIVKLWAKRHNLNDPKNSSISSYSLSLMVINFLQCGVSPPVLPCLQKLYPEKFAKHSKIDAFEAFELVEPFPTANTDTIGTLFTQFMEYYSKFDYANYVLSVRTGTIIPVEKWKSKCNATVKDDVVDYLNIEEPFNFTNTAKSVHNGYVFNRIMSTLAASWLALEDGHDLDKIFEAP